MKFRVATNHGTFNFDAVDAQDARRQANQLTYGPTRVYSVDTVNEEGVTGAELAVQKAEAFKQGSLYSGGKAKN